MNDLSIRVLAILGGLFGLPDGREFIFWEQPLKFTRTYYVDGSSPQGDDGGPGTRERPFAPSARPRRFCRPASASSSQPGPIGSWFNLRAAARRPTR